MNRNFSQTNVVIVSLILYGIIYGSVAFLQPSFLYKSDKSLRQFGVGYKNKTIFPA